MRLRAIISIFVAFLLKGSLCFGQHRTVEFPDSHAKFTFLLHYSNAGIKEGSIVEFVYKGDTVDSLMGQKIRLSEYWYEEEGVSVHFCKEDSLKVWRVEYVDGYPDIRLWYNFHNKVGEGDPAIISIDTIVNQGIARRVQRFDHKQFVIEGIGYTDHFNTLNWFYNGLLAYLELLCYHENGELKFMNPNYNTCDTSWLIDLSNVADNLQDQVTTYPNPTTNSVQIDFTEELSGEIEMSISDCNGKVVQFEMLKSSSNSITLNLEAGVYFVSLVSEKYLVRRKLIVE